jgi:hypothetical protein
VSLVIEPFAFVDVSRAGDVHTNDSHVSIQPLSCVDAATSPSVDAVTRALVVYECSAVDVFFAICEPALHAIAMSAVVVPVALVLGTVILCVYSCSVEQIVLPLAIVGVVSS